MIIVRYNRRALCAGDDVYNGVYKIEMPDYAVLRDLVDVVLHGGKGNTWPLVHNHDGWLLHSNAGNIAYVSGDLKLVTYIRENEDSRLSALGIKWIFGEFKGADPGDTALSCRSVFNQDRSVL